MVVPIANPKAATLSGPIALSLSPSARAYGGGAGKVRLQNASQLKLNCSDIFVEVRAISGNKVASTRAIQGATGGCSYAMRVTTNNGLVVGVTECGTGMIKWSDVNGTYAVARSMADSSTPAFQSAGLIGGMSPNASHTLGTLGPYKVTSSAVSINWGDITGGGVKTVPLQLEVIYQE